LLDLDGGSGGDVLKEGQRAGPASELLRIAIAHSNPEAIADGAAHCYSFLRDLTGSEGHGFAFRRPKEYF